MSRPPVALVEARQPAILLDRPRFGVPLEVYIAGLADDDPWRDACVVRLADLLRMTDPARARSLLSSSSDEAAGVLALASLEEADAQAAREVLPRVVEPVRTLVLGRLDLLEGRESEALPRLDALIEDPEVSIELRAEALSFRARDVVASWHRRGLARCCGLRPRGGSNGLSSDHGAFVTAAWVGTWRAMLSSEDREAVVHALAKRELAELLGPLAVEVDRASLGPVPLHVHGAMVVYRNEPSRIAEVLVPAAALLWRLEAHDDAFRTVHFGARIGHRLYGLAVSQPLLAFATALARHAGSERWSQLSVRLREDEAAFLRSRDE